MVFSQVGIFFVVVAARAWVIEVFPVAAADGEVLCRKGLGEKVRAYGLIGRAEPCGQHVEAIFGGMFGELGTYDGGDGGHEISLADELIACLPSLDFAGPTHNQWHAMPAFPLIALDSAPGMSWIVLMIGAHVDGAGDFGAVVAGENHDGVVGFSDLGESFH